MRVSERVGIKRFNRYTRAWQTYYYRSGGKPAKRALRLLREAVQRSHTGAPQGELAGTVIQRGPRQAPVEVEPPIIILDQWTAIYR